MYINLPVIVLSFYILENHIKVKYTNQDTVQQMPPTSYGSKVPVSPTIDYYNNPKRNGATFEYYENNNPTSANFQTLQARLQSGFLSLKGINMRQRRVIIHRIVLQTVFRSEDSKIDNNNYDIKKPGQQKWY